MTKNIFLDRRAGAPVQVRYRTVTGQDSDLSLAVMSCFLFQKK